MRRALGRLVAALLALGSVAPASAQTPDDLVGLYSAQRIETATALELERDGRFAWIFSMGALDLVAHGRWRRDGDAVILDSDPVTAPAFTLVRTEPTVDRRLRVRFDPESQRALAFVDIELEYADGTLARDHLQGPGYVIAIGGDRRIVAYRLGSAMFDFRSERFTVPASGETRTYHFEANDLGTEKFVGQRIAVSPAGLGLSWRGDTLQYVRAGPPDGLNALVTQAAADGSRVQEAVPAGPLEVIEEPPPSEAWEVSEATPSLGRVDFELGEPFAATIARSSFAFPNREYAGGERASGVAELRVAIGDKVHDFGRVAGLAWRVDESDQGNRIGSIGFSAQDRLLDLGEALGRAREIQSWLVQAGFSPGVPEGSSLTPFQLIDPYRYEEQAAGWDEAATILADEDQGIQGMHLFMMRAQGWYAQVSVINHSRGPDAMAAPAPGREWTLDVELYRDTDMGNTTDAEEP